MVLILKIQLQTSLSVFSRHEYKFLCRFKQITQQIHEQSESLGLLLLLFELNIFLFLIDIINNMIHMSISCDQYTALRFV